MKRIFTAAIVALAIATTGTVGASAAEKFDAAKFFEKIQLYGH